MFSYEIDIAQSVRLFINLILTDNLTTLGGFMRTYSFYNAMSQLIAKAQLTSERQAVELCFALLGATYWQIEN